MTPRVAILHVGGTIGMVPSDRGLIPGAGVVEPFLESFSATALRDLPDTELILLPPLVDSADMRPPDWMRVARAVADHYDDFDGFVVLHGTDTMVYTASALSFLLHGLGKPVVFTGAQLPLGHLRSDGRQHIVTSLVLAGYYRIPEVSLYFSGTLLRGNRCQKVNSNGFVAFSSGNLGPLASVGVEIDVHWHRVRRPGNGACWTAFVPHPAEVVAIRLYPGITARVLRQVLAPPVEGVILETYGSGTFPSADTAMLAALREAVDRGVVVVNCSQVHAGTVRDHLYGTGAALAQVGVVSGLDMTPEAALTKLWCLLAAGHNPEVVRERMRDDLAGELTAPKRPMYTVP